MRVCSLVIDNRFSSAPDGIKSYSHLILIFHMLFATRSPSRPNPIGVTVVKLLERRRNVVRVKGLDAVNVTPILDIKPYTYADVKRKIRTPEWIRLSE